MSTTDGEGRGPDRGHDGKHGQTTAPASERHDDGPRPAHQRLVFADPAAFRYLEEDPSITVLDRRRRLHGYELYIVEQWACSRVHPTIMIITYTGLEQNSVLVGVLSVPTNEEAWSPRLRVYFNAIARFHARKKETPLGTLMVTNLSGFPSALTVIMVPDGDVKKHRPDFIVNENLKRMGCSGRAGLNLSPPVGATQAKFNQLYRTSERIPLQLAVIELVKLCQVALLLFGKLAPEYVDGLLCDVTEQAINDWWIEFGTDFFNIDPSDGILGPTTVAALLGVLLGARNRLHAYGAPVAKDVFDLVSTKRGIAYFQKAQKLSKTRRLDRQTMGLLHRATAKAASNESWTVPRAVKSTVAELSGKGGDMVMGMVGSRDKAGIAEVETLDIETFIQLLSGERSKWLWYGKPLKHAEVDVFRNLGGDGGMTFSNDEHGGYVWSGKKRDSVVDDHPRYGLSDRFYIQPSHGSQASLEPTDKDQALRRTVLKSVTGKMTDARSGLGRIKDAVGKTGLRGHHHKHSKDGILITDDDDLKEKHSRDSWEEDRAPDSAVSTSNLGEKSPHFGDWSMGDSHRDSTLLDDGMEPQGKYGDTVYGDQSGGRFTRSDSSPESVARGQPQESAESGSTQALQSAGVGSSGSRASEKAFESPAAISNGEPGGNEPQQRQRSANHSVEKFHNRYVPPPLLHKTQSLSRMLEERTTNNYEKRWPRHLSFTAVDDVLAPGNGSNSVSVSRNDDTKSADHALKLEDSLAFEAQFMGERLARLKDHDGFWVVNRVGDIEDLDRQGSRDQESLDIMYHQKFEEYHALHETSDELLAEERASLTESLKDVEVLGAKLDYELGALRSKVEEVENAVAEFERQVMQIELRSEELNCESTTTNYGVVLDFLSWFSQ